MEKTSEGPVGVGTLGIEARRFVMKMPQHFEVTGFETPSRFALRNLSGPFEVDREYRIEPDGKGTKVTFHVRMIPKGPMKVLFPLIRSTIERQIRTNIARMGSVLDENM